MKRALIAVALTTALVSSQFVAPANAGTLTSASFTTAGTGYAVTSAQNTRYDWNFNTASSTTLSRVSASVPAGTNTYGPRYLANPIAANNDATTPDSSQNSVTGNIDIRAYIAPSSWTGGSYQVIAAKFVNGNRSYRFELTAGGQLDFYTDPDGTTDVSSSSSVVPGYANGVATWVRVTRVMNDGSGHHVDTYYYSSDGVNWSPFSTTTAAPSTSAYDGTAPLEIGSMLGGGYNFGGKIYFVSVSSGINGTTSSASTCTSAGVVACFNPANDSIGGSLWTSASPSAEVWTVNRSGTNLPSDIASDLTVSNVSGLPAGGTASYRMIDGAAVYLFPAATPVASAVPCSLSLTGFTNTATPGSYTSVLNTNNGGTVLDTATTGMLTFAPASSTTVASATIDPTFTFAVLSASGTCDGYTYTGTSSPTNISLGHVGSTTAYAGQYFQISTNAGSGWNLTVRSTGPLTNGSYNFTQASSTQSPFPSAGTEAFGIHAPNQMIPSNWRGVTTTDQTIWQFGGAYQSASMCDVFAAQTAPTTPAGSYSANIVYTAVPAF